MQPLPSGPTLASYSPIPREKIDFLSLESAQASLQQYRQVLREAKRQGDQKRIAWVLIQIAMILRGQHQYTPAQQLLDRAKGVFSILQDQLGLATVYLELSYINREMVRNALALEYAHQAIKIFQELGRTAELAWAYDNMSVIRFNMFQRHESMTYAKKARAIFMEYGSRIGLAWNSCNLGWLYMEMGFYPQAEQHFSEAFENFTHEKHQQGIAWSSLGLGMSYKEQCKFDLADDHIHKAKVIFKALGIKDREGWCLLNEAAVKRQVGKNDDAILINKRAIQLFGPLRNNDGVAWGLFQIGRILFDRGQFIKAWQSFREALNLHTDISNKKGMAWAENDTGKVYQELSDSSHARECYIKAKVLADQLDEGPLKVEIDKNIARLNIDEGFLQRADETLEQITGFCQKINSKEVELEIYLERARYSIIIGEIEKAGDWLEAADSLLEAFNLHRHKPLLNVYGAEILAYGNKLKTAAQVLQEAVQLSNKFEQRRQRAEALLGLVQIVARSGASPQLTSLLNQLDKDVRVLNSRRLRAKYLFVKGWISSRTGTCFDIKSLSQGIQVAEAAGLPVLQRQLMECLFLAHKREKKDKLAEDTERDIKRRMEKGPVDLYLVRSRHEMFDTMPVSLTS